MEDDQQFCLRWNNHQNTLISNFDKLLENGTLVDCTLAAEGQFLKAHKVVLSACSPYFANLLKEQYDKHPIFILKDVKYQELRAMMDYMYRGEVNISQDQLAALLKAAESLQIKGLSDRPQRSTDQHPNINVPGRMQHPHGGGYTLEQTKRPRLGPVIDTPDMREGSSSPTSRKRKKLRRRSIENVMDNHEHSNSSAHSTQPINTSTPSITSGTAAIVATSQQQQQQSQQSLQQSSVSQQQQQQGSIVGTKKTENVSNIKQTAGSSDDVLLAEQDNQMEQEKQIKKDQNKQQRKSGHDKDELLIEPKNEYEEVNEPIEDLTEDPEELMDEEDLDNQAGPSHHGGEGSSQGFPQWPADRSQDEFIMTAQDQGQQRDPQDLRTNVKTESPSPRYILSQQDPISTPNIVRHEKQQHIIRQQQTSPLPLTNGNKQHQTLQQQQQSHSQQQQQQQNQQRGSSSEIPGKVSGLSIPPAHQLSMSDVSDMLLEFYKANAAKAPKNNKIDKFPRQASPSSADGATSIITSTPTITITPTKIRPTFSNGNESSSTPIHASTIIENLTTAVISKNLNGDEMVAKKLNESHQYQSQSQQQQQKSEESCKSSSVVVNAITKDIKKLNAPFHPRIKYSSVNNKSPAAGQLATIIQPLISENVPPTSTATSVASASSTSSSTGLPQSVVVVPSSVIQPPILPSAPAAAALAAALFRDGYQNFHHQIRAQEQLLKQRQKEQQPQQSNTQQQQAVGSSNGLKNDHSNANNGASRIEERRLSGPPQFPQKYMQNFLMKKDQYSDNEQSSSDEREDDEEDEGKYPEIDDIHLIEGSKSGFNTSNQLSVSMDATDYMSDEAHHKYSMIAAHALRNLEYSLNDYGNSGTGGHHRSSSGNSNAGADNLSNSNSDGGNNSILSKYEVGPNGEVEAMYNCRHCGKKYRWKSTLRRHENVECGGKEPSHQCPYCPYKSKQRGNLGVHVRKHHANLPQLASKRRSKYSQPRD